MAITLQVGDVLMTRLEFKQNTSGVGYNILHWRVTDVRVTATGLPPAVNPQLAQYAQFIGEEIYDLCNTQWAAAASLQCEFTGVTVQSISPAPRSIPFTFTPVAPTIGLVNSEALPLQDCPTFIKRTDFGQRWGIGRLFFYGLAEADQSNGIILPDAVTRLNNFGGLLDGLVVFAAGDLTVSIRAVIWHNGLRDGALVHDVNEIILSDNVIKTQRRRRPGKGI